MPAPCSPLPPDMNPGERAPTLMEMSPPPPGPSLWAKMPIPLLPEAVTAPWAVTVTAPPRYGELGPLVDPA